MGVNPTSDGEVIRISVPALTEERRKELVKNVKKLVKMQKFQLEIFAVTSMIILKRRENGDITEDDLRSQTDDVQKQLITLLKK